LEFLEQMIDEARPLEVLELDGIEKKSRGTGRQVILVLLTRK